MSEHSRTQQNHSRTRAEQLHNKDSSNIEYFFHPHYCGGFVLLKKKKKKSKYQQLKAPQGREHGSGE